MSLPVEVKVVLKDDERTLTQQFLCYEQLVNEEMIQDYIVQSKENFPGDPDSVVVKLMMVVQ